jgi:predicted TIM-barrel fold metal-dependent hydrolase
VFEQSLWQWVCCWQPRAVVDTLVSMLQYNLFERFPRLKLLSIENGGDWVPSLCYNLDRAAIWAYSGPWPCGRLREQPSAYLKRHLWVSPWPDEDLAYLVRCIGAEHVLFGSDFPHPEGCREPREFADSLSGFPEADVKRIMRDNLEGLLAA